MNKKRELDSITPNFDLTDEQIDNLKRIAADPEYARELQAERESRIAQHLEELKQTILTGTDEKGHRLPSYYINQLKKIYERRTGEKL